MALHVELVSPDRVDYSGEAQMVIARTVDGDAAFMDGHIPFIGTLSAAPLRVISEDGTEIVFAVHQGFIEVSPPGDTGTRVTILSDTSELSSDIDVPRATAAKAAAEAALAANADDAEASFALRRASVRIAVAANA